MSEREGCSVIKQSVVDVVSYIRSADNEKLRPFSIIDQIVYKSREYIEKNDFSPINFRLHQLFCVCILLLEVNHSLVLLQFPDSTGE